VVLDKDIFVSGDEIWPGRFLFIAVEGTSLDEAAASLLREVRPGGVVLREANLKDAEQTIELVSQIKNAVGLGPALYNLPLIAVAQEGGKVNPLGIDPAPAAADLGRAKDAARAQEIGRLCGSAAISRGIGVVLAPVLDVLEPGVTDPAIEPRLFGSDQGEVARLGIAFAEGLAEPGAIAVAKFYPGLGKPRKDEPNEGFALENEPPRLAELMYPFDEAAREGIPGILVGHVAVPALDGQFPKRPASLSPVMVETILRQGWHYPGVILADDVTAMDVTRSRTPERAVVEALAAGGDAVQFLDPHADRVRAACAAVQEAINNGSLSRELLAQSRERLDAWQKRLARAKSPAPPAKTSLPETAVPAEEPPKPEAEKPAAEQPPREETKTPVAKPEGEKPAAEPPSKAEGETPPAEPAPGQQPETEGEKPAAGPAPEPEVAPGEQPKTEGERPATEPAQKPETEKPAAEAIPKPESAKPEPETPAAEKKVPVPQPLDTEKILHKIEAGDTIERIAARYGVKVRDIMAWNGMTNDIVKLGYTLTIYKPLPKSQAKDPAPAPGPGPEEGPKTVESPQPVP
jgi:beta-glucosidase-like glycosyl hydrolase/LysM repeat protein